ncbi:MAG: tetratricopeptide repeat protein [Acidobacteria bacterium]|nr:tetratricopeptide repeat protein [Acidobacteriota bacterium]
MKRFRISTLVAVLVVFALLLSGCQYVDKLKARDQLNKGVKSFRGKQYNQAIEFFTKALEMDPELNIVYEYLGMAYMKQYIPGQEEIAAKAILAFQKALEKDPKNVNALLRLARAYYTTGKLDDAAQCYQQIHSEIDPQNPMPLFGIGLIKWDEAKNVIGDNGQRAEMLFDEVNKAKEEVDAKQKEITQLQRQMDRARTDERRQELQSEIEQIQMDIQAREEIIRQPQMIMKTVDEAIAALEQSNELKEDYMTVRYLSLCYFQKAALTDDEEAKTEFRKKASRLAIKELQLKKQQEEQEGESDQMF